MARLPFRKPPSRTSRPAADTDGGFLRRYGPIAALGITGAVIIGGLALLPARTWTTQREATEQTESDITFTRQEIAELEARLRVLETDSEVERVAREDFDLVFPGEESYRILPPPSND